jgi:hypothetical protein
MTKDEAVDRARQVAAERGLPWLEPAVAEWRRRWFIGPGRWTVVSNAAARGCNVRVLLDDGSGAVIEAAFNPR